MLPLHHVGFLISPLYPCLLVYVARCLRVQCRLLHSSPWNCQSCNAYNHIHIGNYLTYIHTHGRFNNHTTHIICTESWSGDLCHGFDEQMGNAVPRAGLEPTTPAFQTSMLPLHHTGTLMSPLSSHPPVYVALCNRGQCKLLH